MQHLHHAAMTLCRHTDILEDGTLRDNGNRNYEFVVRTIATVGNYGMLANSSVTLSLQCAAHPV